MSDASAQHQQEQATTSDGPAGNGTAAPAPAAGTPPAPRIDQSAVNAYDRLLQEKERVIRE